MSLVHAEHVLVVPTGLFRQLGYFQGFSRDMDRYLTELFSPEHTSYRPRAEVEEDPSFKQLIPYVIFRHLDSAGRTCVFQYRRGSGQGEKRLHAKRSVGVGGHISVDDAQQSDPYEVGLRRELDEEIRLETACREQTVGLINDDETEVGKVHLGVVHIFDVDEPQVFPREEDITEAGFQPVNQLLAARDEFESWSRICLEALFEEN